MTRLLWLPLALAAGIVVLLACLLHCNAEMQAQAAPVSLAAAPARGTPAPPVAAAQRPAQGAQALPQELLQRTAVLALRGQFGHLQPWQVWWYRHVLQHGIEARGWAGLTTYGRYDPPQIYGGDFFEFRGSHRLSEGICAADCGIPKGSIVWCPWGLALVGDRGGAVHLGRTRGASAEFDYWSRRPRDWNGLARYVVLRRGYGGGSPSPPLDPKG